MKGDMHWRTKSAIWICYSPEEYIVSIREILRNQIFLKEVAKDIMSPNQLSIDLCEEHNSFFTQTVSMETQKKSGKNYFSWLYQGNQRTFKKPDGTNLKENPLQKFVKKGTSKVCTKKIWSAFTLKTVEGRIFNPPEEACNHEWTTGHFLKTGIKRAIKGPHLLKILLP